MTASVSIIHLPPSLSQSSPPLPSSLTTAAALDRCLSQHLPLISAFVGKDAASRPTFIHQQYFCLCTHLFLLLLLRLALSFALSLSLTYSDSLARWLAVRCVDVGCRGDEGISEMFRQPDRKEKTVQMGGMN